MAATSPLSWEIAGRNGIGILGLTIFVSVPQLAARIRAYRAALADARPVGKFVNDRVGAFTIVHVADTKEDALRNGGADAAINYLLYAFRVLGGFADPSGRGMQKEYAELEVKSTPYRDLIAKEYPIILKMQQGECTFDDLDREDMVIVGDVDHCIRKVERYRQAGLDQLIALMQADRIPHAQVLRSIELFGKEIVPASARVRGSAGCCPIGGRSTAGSRTGTSTSCLELFTSSGTRPARTAPPAPARRRSRRSPTALHPSSRARAETRAPNGRGSPGDRG
jgi:alkanesulfonate monooxygenase SsuD/methylene tetrahydromethanopterin reductase-like flavin-dependent oxidoreductase (luciferase family)